MKNTFKIISLTLFCMLIFNIGSINIIKAGSYADTLGVKNDSGAVVTDNTFSVGFDKLSDYGMDQGKSTGNSSLLRNSKFLKVGGFLLGAYDTVTDSMKFYNYKSPHETDRERAIDTGLYAIDIGMGWYAIGVGAVALFTAPAWGAGAVAAAGATGTTFVAAKIFTGATRAVYNSKTFKDVTDFMKGKKKIMFAPFTKPGMKEGLDIIKEELGFDLYPGLSREIPDPSTGIPVYKPNIYIYSDEDMSINVKLYPNKYITESIPLYDLTNGWDADVVNGNINGCNDFLFYEALVPDEGFQKEEGFVVQGCSMKEDMKAILDKYGFNQKEKEDFIEYWSEKIDKNFDYIFYPQDNSNIDMIMPVVTEPAADNTYRVWFYITEYDSLDNPAVPENIGVIKREGLTVVEWGGLIG